MNMDTDTESDSDTNEHDKTLHNRTIKWNECEMGDKRAKKKKRNKRQLTV